MKDVNFITTLSPRAQRSIARWYWITWLSVFIVCIGMIGLHIPQLYMWRVLKKQQLCSERGPDTLLQEEVRHLQEQEKNLKHYVACAEKDKGQLNIWQTRITHLFSNNVAIKSCEMSEKEARLCVEVASLDSAKEMINRLQECSSIKSVNLMSLQPMNNGNGYLANCVCEWV